MLLFLSALNARAADPQPVFRDSPYLESIPDPGPCDVVVNESTEIETLGPLLNDPNLRVFCIQPGDYRAAGMLWIWVSGTPTNRRFLRFQGPAEELRAFQRPDQAIFEAIHIFGSWWVVQGLTFLPQDDTTDRVLAVRGGDHNVLDGNLIDAAGQLNADNNGIQVQGYKGDPGTWNSVQANVVRNGDMGRLDVDYEGIMVSEGFQAGENNNFNKILDNEVYDWGDGVMISGHRDDCAEAGIQNGTLIDGNDIYLTEAKRIDCLSGAPDPNGECSCAENGIDVKPQAGPDPQNWTRVTNNRLWGFRPTSAVVRCGGSGSNGQAITAGNHCPGHVVVARNIVIDSTQGITVGGRGWIVAGNVIHEVRKSERLGPAGAVALFPASVATDVRLQFNTIVGADNAYDDQSSHTDTRCNVVIDDAALNGAGGVRGLNHSTEHNFLYEAPAPSMTGTSNAQYPAGAQSANTELCFWRKRWTAPERVCIPQAAATPQSPHMAQSGICDASITEPFGIGPTSYMTAPEAAGGLSALAGLLALAATSACRRGSTSGARRSSRDGRAKTSRCRTACRSRRRRPVCPDPD